MPFRKYYFNFEWPVAIQVPLRMPPPITTATTTKTISLIAMRMMKYSNHV
jgi:hypothetical protein